MTDREDARRAALMKLLEDWEEGRMTEADTSEDHAWVAELWPEMLIANDCWGAFTLTPAGIAAARAIREGKDGS